MSFWTRLFGGSEPDHAPVAPAEPQPPRRTRDEVLAEWAAERAQRRKDALAAIEPKPRFKVWKDKGGWWRVGEWKIHDDSYIGAHYLIYPTFGRWNDPPDEMWRDAYTSPYVYGAHDPFPQLHKTKAEAADWLRQHVAEEGEELFFDASPRGSAPEGTEGKEPEAASGTTQNPSFANPPHDTDRGTHAES